MSIYGTGLGQVNFPPSDGSPASSNPLSRTQLAVTARLGLDGFGQTLLGPQGPLYSGLAPGLIGVGQFVFQIPYDAPEGCAVPLRLQGTFVESQPVTMSIRWGGGPCVDAALARLIHSGPGKPDRPASAASEILHLSSTLARTRSAL